MRWERLPREQECQAGNAVDEESLFSRLERLNQLYGPGIDVSFELTYSQRQV